MAITFTNQGVTVGSGSNAPDLQNNTPATSFTNSSWTPPSSGLIICDCVSEVSSGTANTPTLTGNSLTWVEITNLVSTTTRKMTRFAANASGSSTGTNTWSFAGQSQLIFRASFYSADGTDVDNGVAQTFVQNPTGSGTGTTGTVTLSAAADSNNRPIVAFFHVTGNESKTPRASWTELDDEINFGSASLETQYRGDAFETTASATWTTSSAWFGIASELKIASAGGGGVSVDPMGMTGFFGG